MNLAKIYCVFALAGIPAEAALADEVFMPQANAVQGQIASIPASIATPVSLTAAYSASQQNVLKQNVSQISQIGTNNSATVAQSGAANLSLVSQQGRGNVAVVTQSSRGR